MLAKSSSVQHSECGVTITLSSLRMGLSAGVVSIYPAVSEKLKAVEAEQNYTEIQDIRKALESLFVSAQAGEADVLPAKRDVLKSSFVKVDLKRG